MRRFKFVLIQLLVHGVSIALCLFAYQKGIGFGTAFLGVDNVLVEILLGILGITAAIAVFRWLFRLVNYVLKCCRIYVMCQADGTKNVMDGVVMRFGRALTVSVTTVAVREFKNNLKAITDDSGVSDAVSRYFNADTSRVFYGIVKAGGAVFRQMFDYLDECIIGYCFSNPDKDILSCVAESLACFLQSLKELSVSLVSTSVISVFLKTAYYVIFVLVVLKLHLLHWSTFTILFTALVWGGYIFDSAIIEPIVMDRFVLVFLENCNSCGQDSELINAVKRILPSLNTPNAGGSTD